MGEVFPADDPVARWLVTMSVGLNDVVFANGLMEKAEKDYEDLYFFRLASSHLWELAKFITDSHDAWDEIQQFVSQLPDDARKRFEAIRQVVTTGELSTVGKELVQVRDLFSHYQEMDDQARKNPRDPITKALDARASEEIELEVGKEVRELRLSYGDEVIGTTVMRLIPDEEAQKRVLGKLAEAVGHVTTFVQVALNAWLEPRMDKLTHVA
jgi:hypothetical protein